MYIYKVAWILVGLYYIIVFLDYLNHSHLVLCLCSNLDSVLTSLQGGYTQQYKIVFATVSWLQAKIPSS